MRSNWIPGRMDPDRKQEIRQSFAAAIVMRKRLLEILEKKRKASWEASVDENGYDCANWALKQADARGYERALREISKLIE